MKFISDNDETNLVEAVKSAADTIVGHIKNASACDLEGILVDSLRRYQVPERFYKQAATSANRVITINVMQSRDETSRAEPFPLIDPDKLAAKNFASTPEEEAKVTVRYMKSASMTKTASSVSRTDDPITDEALLREHLMHPEEFIKVASAQFARLADTLSSSVYLLRKHQGNAKALSKTASRVMEFHAGDTLRMLCAAPRETGALLKQAGIDPGAVKTPYGVDPCTPVSTALHKVGSYVANVQDYDSYVAELIVDGCKALSCMETLDRLTKQAGVLDNVKRNLGKVSDAASSGFDSLRSKFEGLFGKSEVPDPDSDLSDPEFDEVKHTQYRAMGWKTDVPLIRKEREIDRIAAWSDIMADKSFSNYDIPMLNSVIFRVMDVDPHLERPNNRELLRKMVGRALSQNSDLSLTDLGAVSKILESQSRSALAIDTIEKADREEKPSADVSLTGALQPAKDIVNYPVVK